jgi:hypothetical protein
LTTTATLTGRKQGTVTDWFNICREVYSNIVHSRLKMVETQIDKARFAGKRNYNRGRLLNGDKPPSSEDTDVEIQNSRNHGQRVDGPWVLGPKKGSDCRYFYVLRRDKNTLLPIIQRGCEVGYVIYSHEWVAYRCLNGSEYIHKTINHQQNYVDPSTESHTQSIERS